MGCFFSCKRKDVLFFRKHSHQGSRTCCLEKIARRCVLLGDSDYIFFSPTTIYLIRRNKIENVVFYYLINPLVINTFVHEISLKNIQSILIDFMYTGFK